MFPFWNSYILKHLRLETLTFSDITLIDINVVWCYVLSQYRWHDSQILRYQNHEQWFKCLKDNLFYICLLMYSNSIPLLSVPKTSSTWKANLTVGADHKVLSYIEYRAVSGVFRTLTPHPLSTQRVCFPPAPKAGGYTLARRLIFRKTPDIGLASYSIIPLRGRPTQACGP